MKSILLFFTCMLLSLAAILSPHIEPEESTACRATVTIESGGEVYELQMEYSVDGRAAGICGSRNANGALLEQGDELVFDFPPENFADGVTLDADCFVVLPDGSRCSAGGFGILITEGADYRFALSGNAETGFCVYSAEP